MNETPPPLPQPSGQTCPNCGAAQAANVTCCSQCGAPLKSVAAGSLSSSSKKLLSMLLTFGAIALCYWGNYYTFIGVMGGDLSADWGIVAIGAALLLAAGACVWGIYRLSRKR